MSAPEPEAQVPTLPTTEQRQATLASLLYNEARKGWRVEAQGPFEATVAKGHRHSHLLHIILTILTAGLWLLVWIPLAIFGGEKRKLVGVDPAGRTYSRKV